MGDTLSDVNYKNNSTVEEDKQLDLDVIEDALVGVTNSYFQFLRAIALYIVEGSDDLNREKRKFCTIKKELFEFLIAHKNFYKLKAIGLELDNGSVLYEKNISYSDFDDFMKLEEVLKYNEKLESTNPDLDVWYNYDDTEEEIIKKLKTVQGKSCITNEDILQFLNKCYLVEENELKSNCSNYKELEAYIKSRAESYIYTRAKSCINGKVSDTHTDKISFKFKQSIKGFEDEKSCGVCLEDYKEDQEVCRLPCNHFCCRNCTEQMFAIPKDGSKANYQCPICRGDCN